MIPRLVVFGGSGFLGSHICRTAVQRGVKVTSISRTEPKNPIGGIEWRRGDIFEPDGYREALKDANGVIYTAGVLLEGDYKSLAQGDFDPGKFARLVRERVKGRNPLAADPNNPSGYNRINRDGVAKEARRAGAEKFTFISAADTFPGIPRRYVTSKREAEKEISQIEGLKSVIIRPGLMFSNHDRPHLTPLKGLITGLATVNTRLGGCLPFGAAAIQPLDVDLVARAAIKATLDPEIHGIIDVNTLSELGV